MAYVNEEGYIDCDNFRHALMTWGDKFSAKEVDEAYANLPIDDDNMMDADELIGLLIAGTGTSEEDA